MTNGGKRGFCGKHRRDQWLVVGGREAGTTQSPSRETPWQSCQWESKPLQVLSEGPVSGPDLCPPHPPHRVQTPRSLILGPGLLSTGTPPVAGFSQRGATARQGGARNVRVGCSLLVPPDGGPSLGGLVYTLPPCRLHDSSIPGGPG